MYLYLSPSFLFFSAILVTCEVNFRFSIAIQFYLDQSERNDELIAYLGKNQLDPIRAQELPWLAWAEDKMKLESSVRDYLKVKRRLSLLASSYDANSSPAA